MILHPPQASDPKISVAVGITVGLLASLVQSLGLTIQRKSHIQNHAQSEENRKPDYRRPLWLIGFGIFITSNVLGSVFQIASLPIVLLAPLGAVSLLWNAFFARLILGDVFSPYMVFGTLSVVAGAILIGLFGIVPEPAHSLDDLLRLFHRTSFVVYFSLLGVVVLAVLIVTHIAEWNYFRRQPISLPPSPPLQPTILSRPSIPPTINEETPLLLDNKPPLIKVTPPSSSDSLLTLLAVSYASMSGILSGMCLIFAKSGVELLLLTAAGENQFMRWESWMLVLALVIFALTQLWYLHKSLVLGDPTLVCPLAFCFYNLSTIMNGLIYYDQFDRLSRRNIILVSLGVFVLLLGVWAVSMPQGDEGEISQGGVLDGDQWTAATTADLEADGAISLTSPTLSAGGRYDSFHRRAVTTPAGPTDIEEHVSPLTPNRQPSRRTVSSPSSFQQGLDDELPLSPDTPSESTVVQSVDALDSLRTPPTRVRTLSGSSQYRSPPHQNTYGGVHLPYTSPPRRRGRRGTVAVDGSLREGSEGTFDDASRASGSHHSANAVPVPVPGFSIGLSPLSPGFALMPRERLRDSQTSASVLEEDENEIMGNSNGHGAHEDAERERDQRSAGSTLRRWLGVQSIMRMVRRTSRS